MSNERIKILNAMKAIAHLRGAASESIPCYVTSLGSCVIQSKDVFQDPGYALVVDKYSSPTERFCYAALYLLQKLAETFSGDPVQDLLSSSQQITIRIALQMLFSIGVLRSLKPTVHTQLLQVSKELHLYLEDVDMWSLEARNEFLTRAVFQLISLLKAPNLRTLILVHLGGLLCAVLQGLHYKPDPNSGETDFSDDMRARFAEAYDELSNEIYKPLMIKELLILLAPKRDKSVVFPVWLERAVLVKLTNILIESGGVAMTIRACCPFNTSEVKWTHVMSLAKLISSVHDNIDTDVFYSLIAPQVISLLQTTGPYCLPIAKMSIKLVLRKDSARCDKYFFKKLYEPFLICAEPLNDGFTGTLIDGAVISRCLDNLSKCFSQGCVESEIPAYLLTPIIKIQFLLYMKISGSAYEHTPAVEQILIRYLSELEKSKDDLYEKMFGALLFDEPNEEILEMNEHLKFEFDASDSIQVVKNADCIQEEDIIFDPKMARAFESIMKLIRKGGLNCQSAMLQLFKYLVDTITKSFSKTSKIDLNYELRKKTQQLLTIKILVEMSENDITTQLVKNKSNLLTITINAFLQRYLLRTGDDDVFDAMSLLLSLRLLNLLTCEWQPGDDGWKTLDQTISHLQKIILVCPEDSKVFCRMIYERIITEGAVNGSFDKKVKKDDGLEAIIELIKNPEPAMKGNGLILLKKNYKQIYLNLVERKDEIIDLLAECLLDEDSYVYLAAIQAFEVLFFVDEKKTSELILSIMDQGDASVTLQLKAGEILTRYLQSNPNASLAGAILNVCLRGTQSPDELLRASSFTNLGECIQNFKQFSSSYIQQVLLLLRNTATEDKSVLCRRAATLAAHLTLQSFLQSPLQERDNVLRDFYRLFRHLLHTDTDEVVRIHAGSAIDGLNEHIKKSLTCPLLLEKKISILSIDH